MDTLPGGNGDHLRGLIEKGSEEARKGVAWAMDRVVVVGRKSLEAGEAGREGGETTTPASLVADGNGGEELKTEGKNAMSKS